MSLTTPHTAANRGRDMRETNKAGPVPDGYVRLTVNMEKGLHTELKMAAAEEGTTMGRLLESLVSDYVDHDSYLDGYRKEISKARRDLIIAGTIFGLVVIAGVFFVSYS